MVQVYGFKEFPCEFQIVWRVPSLTVKNTSTEALAKSGHHKTWKNGNQENL